MSILIVDDSSVNLTLLSAILKRAGYECVEASDGLEAIERAVALLPELIILDIMMPGKDGFEVCRYLKAYSKTKDIPIIFLSALGESADKVRGLELGAEDYISKPFDRVEVVARVRTHLRIREMTQSLRRLNDELLEKQERIREDLRTAGEIQRTFLPRSPLRIPGVEASWLFEPCEQVGGDVFNVVPVEPGFVVAYILDVAGHGVPAALVSASVSQTLSPAAGLIGGANGNTGPAAPVDVIRELDREFPLERFDRYFTIAYLILDTKTGELTYVTAGHPAPAVLRRDGAMERLEKGGPFIGLGFELDFEETRTSLQPGDRLVLFTDGVFEHADAQGRLFGEERLDAALRETRGLPARDVCAEFLRRLRAFGEGRAFKDDVSLLVIEFKPPWGRT